MDYLRKKKRLKTDILEGEFFDRVASDESELEYKILKEMRIKQLETLLQKLKPEERILMMMRYTDGFPVLKIADLLHLKEGAVKMRLKRCRAKLIKLLKESHYEE